MLAKVVLAFLPLATLVSADFDGFNEVKHPWAKGRTARCMVNVMDSTNEIFDAGIEAWAASERCSTLPDTTVHCVVDISAVVTSVTRMIEYIMKAINHCGPIRTTNFKCAQSGLKLSTGLTALTSATAKMTTQCPNRGASITDPKAHDLAAHDRVSMGVCVLSIKDGIKHLAKAAAAFTTRRVHCGPESPAWECADMSLAVAQHLVSLGKYILNAASHCGHSHLYHKGTHCGVAVTGVVAALTEIASGGAEVAGHCAATPTPAPAPTIPVPTPMPVPTLPVPTPVPAPTLPVPTPVPAPRLYSEGEASDAQAPLLTPLNAVLLALLPVGAAAGFLGGRRAQGGARRTRVLGAPVE